MDGLLCSCLRCVEVDSPVSVWPQKIEFSLEQGRQPRVCSSEEDLLPVTHHEVPQVVEERQGVEVVDMRHRVVNEYDGRGSAGALVQRQEDGEC